MEIFKFEKSDITRHIEYELRTISKFKEPLNYIIKTLERLGYSKKITSLSKKIDLNKIKEHEGKNYYWSTLTYKNITLAIRRYQNHLTIFTKVTKGVDYSKRPKTEYGAFTLNTDFDKFGDNHDKMMDEYCEKPFIDLNVIIKDLLKLLNDRGVQWVSNSACLKCPEHIEIEVAFAGNAIHSLDSFVFCIEEVESFYQHMFSENTMLKKLKEYENKVGEKLNERYKIGNVTTVIKDNYYHSAGIEFIDSNGKKEFHDVYSLTRWYFKDIFQDKIYIYNGEIYIEGGVFKVGGAVTYKNINEDDDDDDVVLPFEDTFPKENFIPLKKY